MQRTESRMRWLVVVMVLSVAVMLSACAGQSVLTQAQSQSTVILDTYHAAYVDVRDTLNNPTSTPDQRAFALKKRAVLVKIWDILKPYEDIINQGGAINVEDISAINKLIDELKNLATGGK